MFKNFKLRHHGSTVEVTVAQQLHQSERKKSAVYPCLAGRQVFFLDFLVLFYQEKKYRKNQKVNKKLTHY